MTFHIVVIISFAFLHDVIASDILLTDESSGPLDVHVSPYLSTVLAVGVAVSAVLLLIGCASLCPTRTAAKEYGNNDDAYFSEIQIGVPPLVQFNMIPPVESTPESPVVFEPLPHEPPRLLINRKDERGTTRAVNVDRLRPKIFHIRRERTLSIDSEDGEVFLRDTNLEKQKLDRILSLIIEANCQNRFPRAQLQYIKELGSGWFGKVLQGEGQRILPGHKQTKVVVQMLKEGAGQHDQLMFLQEGCAYRDLEHKNVVKVLGQCVETQPYLTILEFCPLGDLKSFLITRRDSVASLDRQGVLLNITCDIAAGLQEMHQHFYVHRDFALRNCLVGADLSVKVGDYGLAESTFKEDYLFDAVGTGVPLRWLAPEVVKFDDDILSLRPITRDCNLWSFGVALWEVVTFGAQPYADLSDVQVLQHVIADRSVELSRPDAPITYIDRLYELMRMCWVEPTQRPSLRELHIMLLHLRSSKDQSDTAAFDEKWNQLLPRHNLEVSAGLFSTNIENHVIADSEYPEQDATIAAGGGRNRNLGLPFSRLPAFAHARPNSFESDLSELNSSMRAMPGSRQMSLRSMSGSRTGTPDSPSTRVGGFSELGSPMNELSFAAEMNASGIIVRGSSPSKFASTPEDDESIYWMKSGAESNRAEIVAQEGDIRSDFPSSEGSHRGNVRADVHVTCGESAENQKSYAGFPDSSAGFPKSSKSFAESSAELTDADNNVLTSKNNDSSNGVCETHNQDVSVDIRQQVTMEEELLQDFMLQRTNDNQTSVEEVTSKKSDDSAGYWHLGRWTLVDSNGEEIKPDNDPYRVHLEEGDGATEFSEADNNNSVGNIYKGAAPFNGKIDVSVAENLTRVDVGPVAGAASLSGKLEVATEMERFAAGEELLGDDTDFGEYFQKNHASVPPQGGLH